MEKIKRFDEFVLENYNIESINESIWPFNKISKSNTDKIKSKIDGLNNDEKIEFINSLISKYNKTKRIFWVPSIITSILVIFNDVSFAFISPIILSYSAISYFIDSLSEDLGKYKSELEDIEKSLKKEIDEIKSI